MYSRWHQINASKYQNMLHDTWWYTIRDNLGWIVRQSGALPPQTSEVLSNFHHELGQLLRCGLSDQPSLWDVEISDIVGYVGYPFGSGPETIMRQLILHRGTILGYPAVFDIPRLRKNQMFGGLAHAAKHADVSHVPHVVCQDCAKPWMAGMWLMLMSIELCQAVPGGFTFNTCTRPNQTRFCSCCAAALSLSLSVIEHTCSCWFFW